jgi:hypothetical protein
MTTYERDEVVTVVISNVRVHDVHGPSLSFEYGVNPDDRDDSHLGSIWAEAADVEIHRVLPAAGMPRAGELWEDADGTRWLAVEKDGNVLLYCGKSGGYTVSFVQSTYGPIKPVYRDATGGRS